jgi:deoxyribodipyrimidine photo-lyase
VTTLVWFRHDLRVADNPALAAACRRGRVTACFLVCLEQWRSHDVGEVRLAYLRRSVIALGAELAARGVRFEVLGAPHFRDVPGALLKLAGTVGATRIAFNAEYPLNEAQRDLAVRSAAQGAGIEVEVHHGGVALAPGTVTTAAGNPYTVFTPFRRRWLEHAGATVTPVLAPRAQGEPVAPVRLEPWTGVRESLLADLWPAGERVAKRMLTRFIAHRARRYSEARDHPGGNGTSRLSPHLSVGSLSVNQCLAAARRANGGRSSGGPLDAWINELIWREFYRNVVAAFPHVCRGESFRRQFDALRWRIAPAELEAWQQGATGYPFVDAGMRQLRATGWMHNRLRMITASFLAKHLLIDWREGERHFMRHLVDGDFAANNGGWQWSASTGTDASPWFRIFNPTIQGRRFDPDGAYTRALVPELADVGVRDLFNPRRAEVPGYPAPIVDHDAARERALAAYRAAASVDS